MIILQEIMAESYRDGMTLTTSLSKRQTPFNQKQTAKKAEKEFAVDVKYHEVYKAEKDPKWLRKKLVAYAQTFGKRAASREFQCSINTVRMWYGRKDEPAETQFQNRSRCPKTIPNKTNTETEQQVLQCWEREHMGGHNLKHQYDLPIAGITAYRILKRNGKTKLRKKKHQKSKDLRKLKAQYKCFEVVQIDGKVLTDIPNLCTSQAKYQLPIWEITFTCEKSGATFIAYCNGETSLAVCTFVVYVLEHLKRFGITVRKVKTDKGSFAVARRSLLDTNFQKLLKETYKIKHQANVHKNQNADVERFHGLIEQYFYDLCRVTSKRDFYQQAADKQVWFNFIRKNSGKNWQTPLDILRKDFPQIDPQVLALRPIDLDQHTEMYMYKIKPDYKPITFEDFFMDVPEENLQSIRSGVYQYAVKLDDFILTFFSGISFLISLIKAP
jgi:transposase